MAVPGGVTEVRPNPAFLLKHPTKPVMYASTECIHAEGCGEVLTLAIGPGGALTEVGRTGAGGRSTCYLALDGTKSWLCAVNYWDAIVAVLPVGEGDGRVGAVAAAHMQPGASYVFESSPDRNEHWTHRQRWPHTHCFVSEPYSGAARVHLVPDLGRDVVWAYALCPRSGAPTLLAGARLQRRQGPRHLVFHPRQRTCYLINELKSTVSVLHFHADRLKVALAALEGAACGSAEGTAEEAGAWDENVLDAARDADRCFLTLVATHRTLPAGFESDDHHRSHASEIRLHPTGSFLLVANRGHDSLACFAVDSSDAGRGGLRLVGVTPSGGHFPRNFNFSACGRFVVVGNQNSNTLNSFRFDLSSGALTAVDVAHQPSPNFVYALPAVDDEAA